MENDFPFKVLTEQAALEDKFQNKVHSKIAETIKKLVCDSEYGFTIGLEGEYGSGKSTVLNLLKEKLSKLEKHTNIIYPFDAWAHEGDPLKRAFLEGLIEKYKSTLRIDDKKGEIESDKLKDQIAGKIKSKHIETTNGVTLIGFCLTVVTFLIPLGISILRSADSSEYSIFSNGPIHSTAFTGFLLIGSPIIIILIYLINLHIVWVKTIWKSLKLKVEKPKYKTIYSSKRWAFFSKNSNETTTVSTTSDIENTSVEFEFFFKEILEKIFHNNPDFKLIVILDNIDRVQLADTNKLFSLLQAFLIVNENLVNDFTSYFKRIFVIIPYDPKGLKFELTEPEKDSQSLKAFLQKSIQIRLYLPSAISRDWIRFSKAQIEDTFTEWPSQDVEEFVSIFHAIYSDPSVTPTPRQIKIYINQVGVFRNHFRKPQISSKVIGYYVIKKVLHGESHESLIKKLVLGDFPSKSDEFILNYTNSKNELASIIFDVEGNDDANILLLERPINSALFEDDSKELIKYESIHKDNFWRVTSHVVRKLNQQDLLLFSGTFLVAFKKEEIVYQIPHYLFSIDDFIRKFNIVNINVSALSIKRFGRNVGAVLNLTSTTEEQLNRFWSEIINAELIEKIAASETDYMQIKEILVAFNNAYVAFERKEVLNKIVVSKMFPWTTVAEIDFNSKLSLHKILDCTSEMAQQYITNSRDHSIDFPYGVIFFNKLKLVKDGELPHILAEHNNLIPTFSKTFGDPGESFIELLHFSIIKPKIREHFKLLLKDIYVQISSHLMTEEVKKKFNIIIGYVFNNEIDEFFDSLNKPEQNNNHYIYSGDLDFVDLLMNDILVNKMWKEFWLLCQERKAKSILIVLQKFYKENKTEVLFTKIGLMDLLASTRLMMHYNLDKKDIKGYCNWFRDHVEIPANNDNNLLNKYNLALEEYDADNKDYDDAFKFIFDYIPI